MEAFGSYTRAGSEAFGIRLTDDEATVLAAVWQTFEPGIMGLLEADLEGVEPEPSLDPSRPPADPGPAADGADGDGAPR